MLLAMSDVTQILSQIEQGDPQAAEKLLPLVYDELRKLAAVRLAGEKPGQTLQATALVHEAYVKLVNGQESQQWNSRGHFFGAAAEAMRRILVDNARRKMALKQGGDWQRTKADFERMSAPETSEEVLAIDEALAKLSRQKPAVAKLVELRYFAGLSLEDAASVLQLSARTAHRYWAYAKAWLHQEISSDADG
jgi:RNA polymerase sigma factor (TIGR02999 family)